MRVFLACLIIFCVVYSTQAQQPVITSIAPTLGMKDDVCIISGNNFNNDPSQNIVYFGLTRATVLTANINEVTVRVPEGVSAADVCLYSAGLRSVSKQPFNYVYREAYEVTASRFGPYTQNHFIETSAKVSSARITRADLNNDGIQDDIVYKLYENSGQDNKIIVQLNQVAVNAQIGQTNGKKWVSKEIFGPAYSGNSSKPYVIDINGDGMLDIMVGQEIANSSSSVDIFVNKTTTGSKDINFERISVPTLRAYNGLFYEDIDNDGKVDIVAVGGTINIYRNTSSGNKISFNRSTQVSASMGIIQAVADLNNDGKVDFVLAAGSNILVAQNNCTPGNIRPEGFSSVIPLMTLSSSGTIGVAVADLDNDTKKDVIASNHTSRVEICQNTSSGNISFNPKQQYNTPFSAYTPYGAMDVKDVNGDAKLDIIFGKYILVNKIDDHVMDTSSFSAVQTGTFTPPAYSYLQGDLRYDDIDNDGVLDAYFSGIRMGNVMWSSPSGEHNLVPIITVSPLPRKRFRTGEVIRLSCIANVKRNVGNVYTAELSDEWGNFSSPVPIGSSADTSTLFKMNVSLPLGLPASGKYKIRINMLNPIYDMAGLVKDIYITSDVPQVTSVSDYSANANSVITLWGNNFDLVDNEVYIGAAKAKVRRISSSLLEATVEEGTSSSALSFHSLGTSAVLGNNFNYKFSGAKNLDSNTFKNPGTGEFVYSATSIFDIRFIDYNGDRKGDVLINGKWVAHNNYQKGDTVGGFTSITITSSTPKAVAVEDINGDGTKDIITIGTDNKLRFRNYTYLLFSNPKGLSAADIDGDKETDIVVFKNDSFCVMLNNSVVGIDSMVLDPRVVFPIAPTAATTKILLSDIDADGLVDVITANPGDSTITVFKNVSVPGMPLFLPPAVIVAPTGFTDIVLCDVNKDGKRDIAITDKDTSGTVSIYLNNAIMGTIDAGTFANVVTITTGYRLGQAIAAGDGDGDGKEDLFIAVSNGTQSRLVMLRNIYTGGIFDSWSFEVSASRSTRPMTLLTLGDINLDGKMDVLTHETVTNTVYAYLNLLKDFKITSTHKRLNGGDSVKVKFTAGYVLGGGNTITAQLSDAFGSFASAQIIGMKASVALSDSLWVVIPSSISGTGFRLRLTSNVPSAISDTIFELTITEKPGYGIDSFSTFTARTNDTITIWGNDLQRIQRVSFGTVNGSIISKQADMLKLKVPFGAEFKPVRLSDGISTFTTNQPFNHFYYSPTVPRYTSFFTRYSFRNERLSSLNLKIASADMDKDGDLDFVQVLEGDIVFQENVSKEGKIIINRGFEFVQKFSTINDFCLADIDNNGLDDIILFYSPYSQPDTIAILLNKSTDDIIVFDTAIRIGLGGMDVNKIMVMDMNNDQQQDILVYNSLGLILIYYNTADGGVPTVPLSGASFAAPVSYTIANIGYGFDWKFGDLNNDGWNDIVYRANNGMGVLINGKAPAAFTRVLFPVPATAFYLDDLNKDKRLDIITGNTSDTLRVYENAYVSGVFSAASFTPRTYDMSLGNVTGLLSADINLDGRNDIMVATMNSSNDLTYFKNNLQTLSLTDSSFKEDAYLGKGAVEMIAGDYDGDQRPDIAYFENEYDYNPIIVLQNNISLMSLSSITDFVCRGKKSVVFYNAATGLLNPGNVFSIQLSDSAGNFTDNNAIIGTKAGITSDSMTIVLPTGIPVSDLYRIRLLSSSPALVGDVILKLDMKYCPQILSFTPEQAEIGATVSIIGKDFSSDPDQYAVYIGKARAEVISASATELKVLVPPSATMGEVSLAINQLNACANKYFTPVFRSKKTLDTSCIGIPKPMIKFGNGEDILEFHDMNGDGKNDILTYNKIFAHSYNHEQDTVALTSPFPDLGVSYGYWGRGSVIEDISGDGLPDQFAPYSHTIGSCSPPNMQMRYVLKFTTKIADYYSSTGPDETYYNFPQCNTSSSTSDVADLDLDGRNEILITNSVGPDLIYLTRNIFTWNPNNGGWPVTFSARVSSGSGSIMQRTQVKIVDVDGDGLKDVLTSENVSRNASNIESPLSRLSVASPSYNFGFPLSSAAGVLEIADFNGDGKPDVLLGHKNNFMFADSLFRIYQNTSVPGAVSFSSTINFYRSNVNGIEIADYNGDGKPDIIIRWNNAADIGFIEVFPNTSTLNVISFSTPVRVMLSPETYQSTLIDVFDIDEDKRPDIILQPYYNDSNVYVLRNRTPVFTADIKKVNYCQADSIEVGMRVLNMNFTAGNQFTLQLSDANGSFGSYSNIGTINAIGGISIKGKIPVSVIPSDRYRLRIISSAPADTSYVTQDSIFVHPVPQPLIISNTPTMAVCSGDSVTLQVANTNQQTSYQWKLGSQIISGTATHILQVKQTGRYSVVATLGACVGISPDTSVTIYTLPDVTIHVPNIRLCAGDSIELSVNKASRHRYQWLYNGSPLANDTLYVITVKQAGSYAINIKDSNQCMNSSRDTIVPLYNNPSSIITSSRQLKVCIGDSILLSAPAGNKLSYTWYYNGSVMSNDSLRTLKAKLAGNYSVMLKDSNGCTALSEDTALVVHALPEAELSLLSASKVCAGDSIHLVVNTMTGTHYRWLKDGMPLLSDSLPSFYVKQTGIYSVQVIDSNLCRSQTLDTSLTVYPLGISAITSSLPAAFCKGDSLKLSGQLFAKASYQWFKDGTLAVNDTLLTLTAKQPGLFSLKTTDENGCSVMSSTLSVLEHTIPITAVSIISPEVFCDGDSAVLVSANMNRIHYQWYMDGSFLPGDTMPLINIKQSAVVSLSSTDSNGCSSISLPIATVALPLPKAQITTTSPTTFCEGDSIMLTGNNETTLNYRWYSGERELPGAVNQTIVVKQSSVIALQTIDSNGCSAVSPNIAVIVHSLPQISLSAASLSFCSGDSAMISAQSATTVKAYHWFVDGTILKDTLYQKHISTAGLYSVQITDSNGCKNTSAGAPVIVYDSPLAFFTSMSPLAFCQGDSTVLFANTGTGYNYSWFRNDTLLFNDTFSYLNVKVAGDYSLKITDTHSCYNITSDTTVTVFSKPAAPEITINGLNLVSSAISGNQWLLNGIPLTGAIAVVYTPLQNGTYQVITTSANGCYSDTSSSIVYGRVGLKTYSVNSSINVYPNPATTMIFISGIKQKTVANIVDMTGRMMFTANVEKSGDGINISSLVSGVYFLYVDSEVFKIVKE